jgi:hypothetical protein
MGASVDQDVARGRAQPRRSSSRLVRRIGTGALLLIASLVILAAVGFVYLRSTPA